METIGAIIVGGMVIYAICEIVREGPGWQRDYERYIYNKVRAQDQERDRRADEAREAREATTVRQVKGD